MINDEQTNLELEQTEDSPEAQTDDLTPLSTLSHAQNSREARKRVYAQLDAQGRRPAEIARILGLSGSGSLKSVRRGAYEAGYVQDLQGERDLVAVRTVTMKEERERFAREVLMVLNKKALDINMKPGEEISLDEAKFCLKGLEVTEHSGRRVDPPIVQVNTKQEIVVNVQSEIQGIVDILGRSGIDLDEIQNLNL